MFSFNVVQYEAKFTILLRILFFNIGIFLIIFEFGLGEKRKQKFSKNKLFSTLFLFRSLIFGLYSFKQCT